MQINQKRHLPLFLLIFLVSKASSAVQNPEVSFVVRGRNPAGVLGRERVWNKREREKIEKVLKEEV